MPTSPTPTPTRRSPGVTLEEVEDEENRNAPPRLSTPSPRSLPPCTSPPQPPASSPRPPTRRSPGVVLEEVEDEENRNAPPRLSTPPPPSPTPPVASNLTAPTLPGIPTPNPVSATGGSQPGTKARKKKKVNQTATNKDTPNPASSSAPKSTTGASNSKSDAEKAARNARRRERRKAKKEQEKEKESTGAARAEGEGFDNDNDNEDDVHGRGCSGIVEKERIEYLEEMLPAYLALGNRTREKAAFWEAFPVEYFELFQIELYPPPPSVMAPLPTLTEAQFKKLSSAQRDARKKAEKRRVSSDEQRVIDQIKRWFYYRQGKVSATSMFDRWLARMRRCPKPPRKLTLAQFLQHHPEHKDAIKVLSRETCQADRLPMRAEAAREYVEEMEPSRVLELEAERDEQYKLALENWQTSDAAEAGADLDAQEQQRCRENFPRCFQPLLDAVSRYTGMSIFLMGGLELDHPNEGKAFDAVT
ncbi:hypothetical protein V5O48_018949, partial [Marasmius crinis-equi]